MFLLNRTLQSNKGYDKYDFCLLRRFDKEYLDMNTSTHSNGIWKLSFSDKNTDSDKVSILSYFKFSFYIVIAPDCYIVDLCICYKVNGSNFHCFFWSWEKSRHHLKSYINILLPHFDKLSNEKDRHPPTHRQTHTRSICCLTKDRRIIIIF